MVTIKNKNKHKILSAIIITCGLLYIFAYQFKLPFKADLFLYGMVVGLIAMTFVTRQISMSNHGVMFILVAISSFIGVSYTTMPTEGLREAILFTFFAGMFVLSLTNPVLVKSFTKWIYLVSIVVMLSSIVQFMMPMWFVRLAGKILRYDAYEQFAWSYVVDNAYAGISAYTSNTTFSAAIVFGTSFLNIVYKKEKPIIKNKVLNIVLLCLSMFAIILCSKRGIFIATIAALVVLLFYLYRGRNFLLKFVGVAAVLVVVLTVLYYTNDFVAAFLNRFTGDNILTGRDEIYETLLNDLRGGDLLIGWGTGATYRLASSGAHNIYIQILYDHGIIFSIPYYVFLIYNYRLAFRNKCPISIFVQTMFLVYGLGGNPLYSNMFVIIYSYYVLYAAKMPDFLKSNANALSVETQGKA